MEDYNAFWYYALKLNCVPTSILQWNIMFCVLAGKTASVHLNSLNQCMLKVNILEWFFILMIKIRGIRLRNLKLCNIVKNICYKQFFKM